MKSRGFVLLLLVLAAGGAVAQFLAQFPQPTFSFELSSLIPAEPLENEEVVAAVRVQKSGPAGTCKLIYFLDGEEREEEFKVRSDSRYFYLLASLPSGYHTVRVENKEFSFYVRSEEPSENAQIEILSFSYEPLRLKLWETVYVKVRVRNLCEFPGWRTVRVLVDGTPVEKRVLVDGGAVKEVYFPILMSKPSFRVRVEDCPQPEENLSLGLNPLGW